MSDTMVETAPIQPSPVDLKLDFHGKPLDYLLILLKTTVLTLISFGLYYPWARAERLRFLFNHTKLGHHAFAFTGNGKEIAIGYLKGLAVYGSLYAGIFYGGRLAAESPVLGGILTFCCLLLFYCLLPFAIWGGKAYRLSRTRYRSIYFSMDRQQRSAFIKRYILDLILVPFTLGLYAPVLSYNISKKLCDATRWGNVPFQFTAKLSESYWLSIQNALFSVLTFGLYTPFALARRLRFQAKHTKINKDIAIHADISGIDILVLLFVPLIVTTLTLGLAYPWVTVWSRRRFLQRFSLLGQIDYSAVRQSKDFSSAQGETMGDLWGVDMSLGV